MRTTVDIDAPVLKDLKKIQRREGKSLGRLISDLLVQSLAQRKSGEAPAKPTRWISKAMGARVDLADPEAVFSAMEKEAEPKEGDRQA